MFHLTVHYEGQPEPGFVLGSLEEIGRELIRLGESGVPVASLSVGKVIATDDLRAVAARLRARSRKTAV